MNRVIKFRGFSLPKKNWVYGFVIVENDGQYYIHWTDNQGKKLGEKVALESVGQFTGLLDKEGKEIYEGDFLRDDVSSEDGETITSFFPVVYNAANGCWCVDNSYYKNISHLVPMIDYFGSDLLVDGNTFDFPNRLPKINFDDI